LLDLREFTLPFVPATAPAVPQLQTISRLHANFLGLLGRRSFNSPSLNREGREHHRQTVSILKSSQDHSEASSVAEHFEQSRREVAKEY
jgi:hypothetical protein